MPLNISEHSRVGEIYGNMFANMGEQYAKYKEKQQETNDQFNATNSFVKNAVNAKLMTEEEAAPFFEAMKDPDKSTRQKLAVGNGFIKSYTEKKGMESMQSKMDSERAQMEAAQAQRALFQGQLAQEATNLHARRNAYGNGGRVENSGFRFDRLSDLSQKVGHEEAAQNYTMMGGNNASDRNAFEHAATLNQKGGSLSPEILDGPFGKKLVRTSNNSFQVVDNPDEKIKAPTKTARVKNMEVLEDLLRKAEGGDPSALRSLKAYAADGDFMSTLNSDIEAIEAKNGGAGGGGPSGAPSSGPVAISSEEEFNKLPKGAAFTFNGRSGFKK